MKRLIVVSLLAGLATGAFGIDFSAGGGISVGAVCQQFSAENYIFWDTYKSALTTVPVGFAAYFDAAYAEAAIGLRGNGNTHRAITTTLSGSKTTNESDDNQSAGFLSLALLARYPFTLGRFSLFPLLGIEYDLNLWLKDQNGADLKAAMTEQEKSDLNQFWFKGGVGIDFPLGRNVSLRSKLTLGLKLLNDLERQTVDTAINTLGATKANSVDTTVDLGLFVQYRIASVGAARR
jgi:hypothetical protein